jgi:hypothetical protein
MSTYDDNPTGPGTGTSRAWTQKISSSRCRANIRAYPIQSFIVPTVPVRGSPHAYRNGGGARWSALTRFPLSHPAQRFKRATIGPVAPQRVPQDIKVRWCCVPPQRLLGCPTLEVRASTRTQQWPEVSLPLGATGTAGCRLSWWRSDAARIRTLSEA